MPQRIDVPGLGVVEFPDGMGDDQIAAAIKRNMPQQTAASGGLSRFVEGLADPVHGGAQLLENAVRAVSPETVEAVNKLNNWLAEKGIVAKLPAGGVNQAVREREATLKTDGVDWSRLAGNVLSPVNMMGAAAAPTTLAGRMATGGGLGAITAGLMPNAGSEADKITQMAIGAGGGAVVPAAVAGLSRGVISPKASTNPDLALLKAEGVKPTVGQTLGGAWNSAEEKLGSLPVFGDAIRRARGSAVEQFNNAAINRATSKIGVNVKGAGSDVVREAGDEIGKAYEAAKNALGNFQLDRTAARELVTLRNMAGNLPPKERRLFEEVWAYLDNEVSPNGSLLADQFKRFDSKAGKEASRLLGASDVYQQKAGEAIKELQRIVLDAGRRANPQAAELLNKADAAYANLVRVENAATRSVNNGGQFTPGQLGMAVRATDRSVRDRATARGTALMQDLATAGQNVLGNKVPNSGTFDRAALGVTTLGGGYALNPAIPAGLLGGALMYSPPAQSLLRGLVSARPKAAKAVAGLLDDASPMFSPAGGLLALDYLK